MTLIGALAGGLDSIVLAQEKQQPLKAETPITSEKVPEKYSNDWYKVTFVDVVSLEKELKNTPTAFGYCRLSDLLFNADRPLKEVEDAIDEAIRLDSNCALAYSNKTWVYIAKAKEEKNVDKKIEYLIVAEKNAKTSYELNDSFYESFVAMGGVCAAKNDHNRAIEWFNKAIHLDDKRWGAYNEIARSLYTLGKKKEALAAFESAYDRKITSQKINKSVKDWITYLKK